MTIQWDAIFEDIYELKAKRNVTFREATNYQLESATVTYASSATYPAKVLWRNDATEFRRGVWQENDVAALTIWFRDLTGNATGTASEVSSYISRFKGQVNEVSREYWSRWIIDDQTLKVRAVYPAQRPDGKIHALRVLLQAAE